MPNESRKKKTRREKRLRLFDLYAANQRLYQPEAPPLFYCPMCLQGFTREAAESDPPAVILAHVFPDSLGGRLETLSCKVCDSRFGHEHETHLRREQDVFDFVTGRAAMDGRLRVDGRHEVGVTATFRENNWHFEHIPGVSDPRQTESLMGRIREAGDFNFTFTVKAYDQKRSHVAVLHSAYLAMFWYFGYEYLLTASARLLRDELMRDVPTKNAFVLINPPRSPFPPDTGQVLIGIIKEPREHRGFAVILPGPAEEHTRGVLIPGFDDAAVQAYDDLRSELPKGKVKLVWDWRFLPPDRRLADPEFSLFGHRWWRSIHGTGAA